MVADTLVAEWGCYDKLSTIKRLLGPSALVGMKTKVVVEFLRLTDDAILFTNTFVIPTAAEEPTYILIKDLKLSQKNI